MKIKFNYRFIIFPPWYVYNAIKNSEDRSVKLTFIEYFFILWITCQWLLMFFSHKNILLGIITANLALLGIFIFNVYGYNDIKVFSEDNQAFLKSIPIKIINAIAAISLMYIMASVPKITLDGLEKYYNIISYSSSFVWTSYHMTIKYLFVFLWIIPLSLHSDKLFGLFPKEQKANNGNLNLTGKIILIITYLMIIFMYFVIMRKDIPY